MQEDMIHLTHTGETPEKYCHSVVPPVFMTSLHVYDTYEEFISVKPDEEDRYVYGRTANPTTRILERKLAALEHGKGALAFSSGMAAATAAIMACCRAGSHIICMRDVYPPVKGFLRDYGIPVLQYRVTFVTGQDVDEIESAIREDTVLIILESPATYVFRVVDLAGIAAVARSHGVKTYIDNTWSTPIYQKPLDFGIDIVMHTLTKYIGGHSDLIGGALVTNDEELLKKLQTQMREWFGAVLGPMEAWLAIRGLRTLAARLECHQDTAMAVAKYLEGHPKVKAVHYPGLSSDPQHELAMRQQKGFSGLMSIELDAPAYDAVRFIDYLKVFGKGCSWGGFESLAHAPFYHASEEDLQLILRPDARGLIRLHCGLEGKENLIRDLEQALSKI